MICRSKGSNLAQARSFAIACCQANLLRRRPSTNSSTLLRQPSLTAAATCSPDTGSWAAQPPTYASPMSGCCQQDDSVQPSLTAPAISCPDTGTWAAEMEKALAPPPTYASALSGSFSAAGRLPAYTILRADLRPGDVWDSHCHLDFLARKLAREGIRHGERLEVSLRHDGENLGDRFGGCVANFCDPRDWAYGQQGQDTAEVLRSCCSQPRVFLAIGCHPHFADRLDGARLLQLERLAGRLKGRFVAIGECGLDRSGKNDIPMQTQTKSFIAQVQLALKLRLPLVLHIRGAEEEGRAVLREQEVPADWPIHRHCFNDSWAVAEAWLRLYPGSKIGLTAKVTYSNQKALHEVARRVPLDRLLLETDAPFMLPSAIRKTGYRWDFSQPGHVVHVAAQVPSS
jgi:TatD DNase family protein